MLARSFHPLALLGVTIVSTGLLAGCSTTPSGEEALQRGPLPFEVGVFLEADGLTLPPESLPESVVRYLDDQDALLEHLQGAISVEQAVVSRVVRLTSHTRSAAMREAHDLDLLLAVGFTAPEEFPPNGLSGGWMSLEVVSWLFGGVPSWFVPSMLYWTGVEMYVEGLDLHQPGLDDRLGGPEAPEFDWRLEFQVPEHNVSLADRAAILDRPEEYALTILVPPSVVKPGDSLRLSRALTDGVNTTLGCALAEGLKAQLLADGEEQPLRVSFLSPDPNRVHEEPGLELALGIASGEGVPISRLVVSRQVVGAAPYVWEADKALLESLASELEADASAESAPETRFVSFPVPEPLPLEPGENVVKVSLRRRDGLDAVRTMVFFH